MMLKKAILLSALFAVSTSVCFADDYSNIQTVEVGLNHYHFGYSESIGDTETGWMNGIHLSYKNQDKDTKQYWKITYDQTNQNTNYNGSIQETGARRSQQTQTITNIPYQGITNDSITDTEITFANPVSYGSNAYLYTGLGFHNWDRNLMGPYGYLEQYSWNYIPVGYRLEYKVNDKLSGALDVSARFMFNGQMNASIVNGTFTLGNKIGFRAELPYSYKMNSQWSAVVTPWYEYSGIAQSNSIDSGGSTWQEPDSMNHQYGVNVGVSYTF